MPLHGFSLRVRALAAWLSLLALCSALMAPASVLAQELRSGQWVALCGSGTQGHAGGDDGHCDLCALPGLALPSAAQGPLGRAPQARALAAPAAGLSATAPAQIAIRGPPVLS